MNERMSERVRKGKNELEKKHMSEWKDEWICKRWNEGRHEGENERINEITNWRMN